MINLLIINLFKHLQNTFFFLKIELRHFECGFCLIWITKNDLQFRTRERYRKNAVVKYTAYAFSRLLEWMVENMFLWQENSIIWKRY